MLNLVLLLQLVLKAFNLPCSSQIFSPLDPIDYTLISRNFANIPIFGFGMWHKWTPMLNPDTLQVLDVPLLQLFIELNSRKTQTFAVYVRNFLMDRIFLIELNIFDQQSTAHSFQLDKILMEGRWSYCYFQLSRIGSTNKYNYGFYYYMLVNSNQKFQYQITGITKRDYSNQMFYSQSLYPNLGYRQYLGYKGELQFKTAYYNSMDEFLAAVDGTCDFPDFCPTGKITQILLTRIVDYKTEPKSNFYLYYFETNYVISGWIKLNETSTTAESNAIRLSLLPYQADDYLQGDRQLLLSYSQNYESPELTQIRVNTFSLNYASIQFYKSKADDVWFVQGQEYEDEVTKWHYFSFQHGQHVLDESGHSNTKIYFKFSSFELIDYFEGIKNHFSAQKFQLLVAKDKFVRTQMSGLIAYLKLDYCFGNTYTIEQECHNLCKTCTGPESNQCTQCQGIQQRVLAESECICKRNYHVNIDPSKYECDDMMIKYGGNIISEVPLTNQCNEGQFIIKLNGQTVCQDCPFQKGNYNFQCAECQLDPHAWYLNPICSSDYSSFQKIPTSAIQQNERLSFQNTLYTISEDLNLQTCFGCQGFIENEEGISNFVKVNHLGKQAIIQCNSCYQAQNNECVLRNENCELCDVNFSCKKCAQNYNLMEGYYCKKCPDICKDCIIQNGNVVCASCPLNYYLSDGTCSECGQNCSICDSTRCYKCSDTQLYYIPLIGKNCYLNTITDCQIAYEESVEYPQIMSLQKKYAKKITTLNTSILKCALCNYQTTNYQTSCVFDNLLKSTERAVMVNGNKYILGIRQTQQGSYYSANVGQMLPCNQQQYSGEGSKIVNLNCRKCILEDLFYRDSWKWDIQSLYETFYVDYVNSIELTDNGYIKCVQCLRGYDLYDGKCVESCPSNCKTCQFIDNQLTCIECKINQNGQQLTLFNNTCIECPYNCALCKKRNNDAIYAINPYFNPDYDEFLTSSYICLKSYQIPGVNLNFDFDLVNYAECADANFCQHIALIDQNLYCESQASYSNYDKYIGDLTVQKYEEQQVLRILNLKNVKKIAIKITLVKGTGQCVFPKDFSIISRLRKNVFSLLELNLEFEGTQDVVFNSNFAISGFNNIIMKNFDVVSNSKSQQIHIYDSISYQISLSNINLVVSDIQFEIQLENVTSVDLNQFTIKDSSLLNSNGIFSIFGYLNTDKVDINIQQITFQNNIFSNSTIFYFFLSKNYDNQNIQISQLTLKQNSYESNSYVFRTNFTVNERKSLLQLTQLNQNQDQFAGSIFANFEGILLTNIQQVQLTGCTFSSKSYWMILPLFKINNLDVQGNYLSTDDVTLISNKASVKYSDADGSNAVEFTNINFENNKYIGNKAFIEIFQSTFLNLAVTIDQLILNQNYLHTLTKLSDKYIASENSTIYLDVNSLILTNTQIIRSKSFPEIVVLNGDYVKILNFNVKRNSDSLRLLNNQLSCVAANIIPQAYTTILYLYNIREIIIQEMTIIGVKSINQPLIQIKSLDTLNKRQNEKITITHCYFAENLLVLSIIKEVQAIISIISEQDQSVIISDSKFLYNYQHSYVSDLSFVSSSTLFFQSSNSSIVLSRMNFEKNVATNGQNSNLVLKCNSIIIQTSSFLQSNQLEFRIVRQNIVWGLSENYVPRQEEYFQAFPIKTFGGSAYLQANITKIIDVNVFGSISLQGGGFYLLPESQGIMSFTNIKFIDCHASLEQVSNAQGGSLFIDASSSSLQAKFYNCTFQNSYSRRDGGVIYVIPSSEKNQMVMENIVVLDSYSIYYSFLKASGSNTFKLFAQNFTLKNSYEGFQQYLGLLYQLSQTELSDYSNNYIFSFSGNLKLYNATITDYMIGIIQLTGGELELISVSITNFTMTSLPLLDLSTMSVIKFIKVVFYNISLYEKVQDIVPTCDVSYSALPLACDYDQEVPTFIDFDMNETIITYYSNLNIKNIQSVQPSPSSFMSIKNIQQSDHITIQNTVFQNIYCPTCQNGLIEILFEDFYDLGSNIVTLENIQFLQSQCGLISCFSFQQNSKRLLQSQNRILISEAAKSKVIYTVKVYKSIFQNNQGRYGGVFYVNDINIVFDKCKFTSNIASEAGGTIYFISKQATMNIYDSEANHNSAKIGGAFFLSNYTLNLPSVLNLQLRNNVASRFGQNYAEYPNQLTLSLDGGKTFLEKSVLFANTTTIIDLVTIKPYNVSNQQKDYLTLPSGQAINSYKYFDETSQQFLSYNLTFRLIALNKQENKIENLDGTKCSIFTKRINISDQDLPDAQALDNSTTQSPFTSVDEIAFNTNSQDYNLDNMIIYFDPKKNSEAVLQIEFLCNSVRISYFSPEPPYLMKYQIENYRLRVNVQSFDCQVGEQKRDQDGTCLVCDSQQDQYTVRAGETCQIKDTISTEAVTSASVKLRAGYWRPYSYSTKIEYCLNMPINCEGGWTPGDTSCFTGHIGALCEQCDIYGIHNNGQWSVSTQYKCGNCNDLGDNTIKVILISCWTIISIMLSVKSTMETVNNMVLGKKFSKYFFQSPKTGYGGILIKVLTNYLQIIGVVATFQLQLPSALTNGFKTVGSPVESMSYSLDCFLLNLTDINIMYFRMIWALIMPIIYILTFFVLYGLAIIVRMIDASKSAITTTFIYLFTFIQPTLLGGFISLLSFRQISNIYWVLGNVAYRYDTAQHLKWVLTFVLPSTFTLALIIPIFMFNSLYQIRFKLDDESSRKNWGYLYNEYQPKAYFWEIVKIFQKSFIIIFLTFYEDLIIIKAALIFIIVFIYSQLTKKYRPYKLPYLNYLDDISTLVCGTSIVLGMTLYSANQSDNQEIIWPFYIFLLFINGVFISIIIWEIAWEQLEGQVEVLDKIRSKINAKFPDLQNANWLCRKLLTNRSEQKKRVKARWRKIREYLMRHIKRKNKNSINIHLEKDLSNENSNDTLSENLKQLSIPRYYNKIPAEIQFDMYGYDSQLKLSQG